MCLQIFGYAWIQSSTGSGKSFGCGDVNLIRIYGTYSASWDRRSANLIPAPYLDLYSSVNPSAFSWADPFYCYVMSW